MAAGTRVLPHAGPTNLRLRLQLPIRVHQNDNSRMRVGLQGWRSWTMNESFVFDESCEHEVEVNGNEPRTVLLVDFSNPLLLSEKDYLSVSMRLPYDDGQSSSKLQAEMIEAAEEWNQAQSRWKLQHHQLLADL